MPADAPAASTPASTDSLFARSIRFAITVTAPIALNLLLGPQPWLVYALITAIASYSVDNGGGAGERAARRARRDGADAVRAAACAAHCERIPRRASGCERATRVAAAIQFAAAIVSAT